MKCKYSVVMCLLIFRVLCNAMECKDVLNPAEQITLIQSPFRVQYCGNTDVIIANRWLDTYLVNLQTKNIQLISTFGYVDHVWPSLLQRKDKKIIISGARKLKICDLETNRDDWFTKQEVEIRSFAYNPSKEIIFLGYGCQKGVIEKHNYKTNTYENIPLESGQGCNFMAMHPKEERMCIADVGGKFSLYVLDNVLSLLRTFSLKQPQFQFIGFCEYSPTWSYIVAGEKRSIFIIDPHQETTEYPCVQAQDNEEFYKITFQSDFIIAILCQCYMASRADYCGVVVRYFDIRTQKPIAVSELGSFPVYDFAISDDGLRMILASKKYCIRTLVSFAVKEKCLYPWFLLRQMSDKNNDGLVNDILIYIGKLLWKTFSF